MREEIGGNMREEIGGNITKQYLLHTTRGM